MSPVIDFSVALDQIELADGATLTALATADVESDDEGTYFRLTSLQVEGRRVEATSWRFAAVAEWIDLNARETFGIVREAHLKATSAEARSDNHGCFLHHQRGNVYVPPADAWAMDAWPDRDRVGDAAAVLVIFALIPFVGLASCIEWFA